MKNDHTEENPFSVGLPVRATSHALVNATSIKTPWIPQKKSRKCHGSILVRSREIGSLQLLFSTVATEVGTFPALRKEGLEEELAYI